MTHIEAKLASLLDRRKAQGRYRQLRQYDTSTSSRLVDMSSNDYLSLTTCPELRRSYISLLESSTAPILGSTGSRLLSGATPAHSALEDRLAAFFDAPACLLFNSGWDANVSFFSAIPQQGDWIVYDELVHASVHDGMRAARVGAGRTATFAHNDPAALGQVLRSINSQHASTSRDRGNGTVFLALESLYSMDGDFARLTELLDTMDQHVPRERQCIVLDEAHTTGIVGKQGRGFAHSLAEHQGGVGRTRASGRVTVRLMTFGKGVGCSGAALLVPPVMREFLINFARPLIFSTALPHSTLLALHAAWDHLLSPSGDRARARLAHLAAHLHALLRPLLQLERCPRAVLHLPDELGPPSDPERVIRRMGPSQILGLVTPRPHALSAFLLQNGFIVRPVVPPTVPPGGERIRICLRSEMDEAVLDRLAELLEQWIQQETKGPVTSSSREQSVSLRAKL